MSLNSCGGKTACRLGACLLEIDDEALQDEGVGDTACASSSSLSNSEKTSDVPVAALPILGILNGCRHAFHASCIQVICTFFTAVYIILTYRRLGRNAIPSVHSVSSVSML